MVSGSKHAVQHLSPAAPLHCIQTVCLCVGLWGWQLIRRCKGTAVCSLGPLGNRLLLCVISPLTETTVCLDPSHTLCVCLSLCRMQIEMHPVWGEIRTVSFWNVNSARVVCHHCRLRWTKISRALFPFLRSEECFRRPLLNFYMYFPKQYVRGSENLTVTLHIQLLANHVIYLKYTHQKASVVNNPKFSTCTT